MLFLTIAIALLDVSNSSCIDTPATFVLLYNRVSLRSTSRTETLLYRALAILLPAW